MTLAIALQVHDGVVFASDSAITMTDPNKASPDNILNVYGHGNKIFNIIKGLPVGGVFYGTANFGSSSVSTLIKDIRKHLSSGGKDKQNKKFDTKNYNIEDIALRIRDYIFVDTFLKLSPVPTNTQFGFIVAGYGSGSQLSETWSFSISGSKCDLPAEVMKQGASSAVAGGDPEAFLRICNGFSPELGKHLLAAGVDPVVAATVVSTAQSSLSMTLVEAAMPIQDAIELAEFFVETTSHLARFRRGFATVGGPTESAAITKHEGFRWVKRKHYFDYDLNPGEKP